MNKKIVLIVISGFLTVSIAYAIRYAFGMLLPEMLHPLQLNKTQAGGVLSAYFIIYTIFSPILGMLSDHYSYRGILTTFTAILGLGALAMSWATGFVSAVFFYSLCAFGHAACWAPVMVLVQKWVPERQRGTLTSIVAMGVGTGIFIWGILLPPITNKFGWRSGWMALGIVGLAIALLNLFFIRNPQKNPDTIHVERVPEKTLLAAYRAIFSQTTFWLVALAYLFVGMNVIAQFAFLPIYTREFLGVDLAISTRFISIIALSGIIGQILLGPASDKFGRIKLMIVCGIMMGSGCLGYIWFHRIWQLNLITLFYGIGYGAVWPLYAAAASDLFPRKHVGGIIGLWTLFMGIGSIISPAVCGRIIDTTGSYTGVFLFTASAGLCSALFLLCITDTHRRSY